MIDEAARQQAVNTLAEMIQDVHVVMLTTVLADGSLRSRPMVRAGAEFHGDLWFFTDMGAAKVDDVTGNPHVNVSYANPVERRYISISGEAKIVNDRKNIDLLWNEGFRQWLPRGTEDPQLCLLRVNVQYAEYWDPPRGVMSHVSGFMQGMLTGGRFPADVHETIDWGPDGPEEQ
jgi:general stress protein 26